MRRHLDWVKSKVLRHLAELLLERPDALPRDLEGRRVVVSAGGTREPLDPVRFLGNRSSGKQGYALARVAAQRGADVLLISGYTGTEHSTLEFELLPKPFTANALLERVQAILGGLP